MEEIIDGINVAECRLYDYGICDSEMAEDLNCEKNHDCYYKQLKRLEQENAELRKELLSYKHPDVVTLLTSWRTGNLDKIHNKIANERDKYKQALEEIRDIAGWHTTNKDSCDVQDDMESIINKINEVLDV